MARTKASGLLRVVSISLRVTVTVSAPSAWPLPSMKRRRPVPRSRGSTSWPGRSALTSLSLVQREMSLKGGGASTFAIARENDSLDSGEPEESESAASTPSIPGGTTAMGSTSLGARPTGRVRPESAIGLNRNTQLEEKSSRAPAVVATSGLRSISRRSGCSASIKTVSADLRASLLAETLSDGMGSGGAFGTAVNPGTTP